MTKIKNIAHLVIQSEVSLGYHSQQIHAQHRSNTFADEAWSKSLAGRLTMTTMVFVYCLIDDDDDDDCGVGGVHACDQSSHSSLCCIPLHVDFLLREAHQTVFAQDFVVFANLGDNRCYCCDDDIHLCPNLRRVLVHSWPRFPWHYLSPCIRWRSHQVHSSRTCSENILSIVCQHCPKRF